jgi:hypothetical protein
MIAQKTTNVGAETVARKNGSVQFKELLLVTD